MDPNCLVSVVIPCFNAGQVISRAVRSVLAQGVPGTEIVIVDDHSTDDSVDVAQALAAEFPAIRVICHEANAGPAAARNAGLRLATGRYVCFLDADDEYAPRFFTTILPLFEQDLSLAWICTGVELLNCHRPVHPIQLDAIANSLPSNLIMRADAVRFLGGFPDDPVFRAETAGEDLVFRTTLKRLFRGVKHSEQFLRYWVSRGSHFDHFLDRTKVVNGDLVFAKLTPDEASGELRAARCRYHAQACERLRVFASLAVPEAPCPRLTDRLLGSVRAYDEMRPAFDLIQGSLHPQEGFALYHFARDGPARGAVVEIGSQFGRSTCWLASGTREVRREKVVAVDDFRTVHQHRKDAAHAPPATADIGPTFPAFIANLQRLGLRDWVDVRVGECVAIGSAWQGPIRFLFLGTNHSYTAVRTCMEIWWQHVITDGIIAIHEVDVSPSITQMYHELFDANTSWVQLATVRNLRLLQRIS